MLWLLLFLSGFTEAAPKKRAKLVEVNPNELDFLNAIQLRTDLGIRYKYRGRTLFLKFNNELHFPGVKKYWLASFEPEEPLRRNLSSCIYDVTKNHEFPQLLDEPNESSLLVFRCEHGCNLDDVGCKPSWDSVKIGLVVMTILGLLVLLLCVRYHKAKDKMDLTTLDVNASILQ